jgi:hypothetical protein
MKKNTLSYAAVVFALLLASCGGSENAAPTEDQASESTEAAASDEEIEVLNESEALHSKTTEANAKLDSIMNNL